MSASQANINFNSSAKTTFRPDSSATAFRPNSSMTALRPSTSATAFRPMSTAASFRPASLGRRIPHKESLEIKKQTRQGTVSATPLKTQVKLTNDHFLETIDAQRYREALETNFEKALVARLKSRKKGKVRDKSLTVSRIFTPAVGSLTNIADENVLMTTPPRENRRARSVLSNRSNEDLSALRKGGQDLCRACDDIFKKTQTEGETISRKIDWLEKKTVKGYNNITNPYLKKEDAQPLPFVNIVNKSNFKKMFIDKMLYQITNKGDIVKQFKQQKSREIMMSKINKMFQKKSASPTRRSTMFLKGDTASKFVVNNIERVLLHEEDDEEDSSDFNGQYDLVLGGAPVEAWARGLNLYKIIQRFTRTGEKNFRKMRGEYEPLPKETQPEQQQTHTSEALQTQTDDKQMQPDENEVSKPLLQIIEL